VKHYKKDDIDTIDLIRSRLTPEEYKGFLLGNMYKYLERHKEKGGIEDIEKMKVYAYWYQNEIGRKDAEEWINKNFINI
jgi:hypothetical protein